MFVSCAHFLWDVKARPPPNRANAQPTHIHLDYSHRGIGPYRPETDSQIPFCENHLYKDPDCPIEGYASYILIRNRGSALDIGESASNSL